MPSAVAIGLDLAWSGRHPTGACALGPAGTVVAEGWLGDDDEIVTWVERTASGAAVLAVDAPLLVPNDTGRRPCESDLHRVYGARKAGPHSSNRSLFLRVHGRVRGEDLAVRFADLGYRDPWAAADRTLLEVYPHPGLVEVFGLAERIPYKAKRGRRVADRRAGLRVLAGYLSALAGADPPLRAPPVDLGDHVRGRALKDAEDLLDARFCAWIAALWHRWGAAAFAMYGDAIGGHIAVPQPGDYWTRNAQP